MDTTTSMLLSGSIIVVGRWVEGNTVNARVIVGIVGSALALSMIGTANQQLAQTFGALVLVTAVFRYGVPVMKKTGLIP